MGLDDEAQGLDAPQRTVAVALALQRHGRDVDEPLQHPHGPRGGLDVVGQDQQAARTQHPHHLVQRAVGVGDGAERERHHDGVERAVLERQLPCVAPAQLGVAPLFSDHKILTQVAGHDSNVIKILPPLVLSEDDVDWFVGALEVISLVLRRCRAR